MRHLEGKTAVITGAASGIGLGMARTFAREGMSVVLCDIRSDRLDAARVEVEAFGAVHVVCNNAGVTMHGKSVADMAPAEWDWVIGVNLYGAIHGVQTFLPLIRAHGGEGHIVNTASIAGFVVNPERRSGAYATTKYAIVALSESLHADLADTPIGVSVLAPAAVNTEIYRSGDNRPDRFGGPYVLPGNNPLHEELKTGLHPDVVGERVVRAIRGRELFVFTHMQTKGWLDRRHQRVRDAFDDCERWLAEHDETKGATP
jgi:NAD(P)-dependent dehydrogenase (short-subunit alcohol dehydrogenase family)